MKWFLWLHDPTISSDFWFFAEAALNTWNIQTSSLIWYGYTFKQFGWTNLSCHSVVASETYLDFIPFNSPSFTSIQQDITDTGIVCMSSELFPGQSLSICHFLKLVYTIFYQIFIFSSNNRPSKTMKKFFYFI